jgi:hypothetical protein
VDTRPWNIQADAGDQPVWELASGLSTFQITGKGERVDEATFRITSASLITGSGIVDLADVVVAFDPGSSGVAFPDVTAGSDVALDLIVDPGALGPEEAPLPVLSILLYGTLGAVRGPLFELFEGTYRAVESDRTATIFNLVGDPAAEIAEQWMRFEPDECGPVYYDDIIVFSDNAGDEVVVPPGEEERIVSVVDDPATPDTDESETWTYHHELSWHRDGKCSGQAQAWTQLAAWYNPK